MDSAPFRSNISDRRPYDVIRMAFDRVGDANFPGLIRTTEIGIAIRAALPKVVADRDDIPAVSEAVMNLICAGSASGHRAEVRRSKVRHTPRGIAMVAPGMKLTVNDLRKALTRARIDLHKAAESERSSLGYAVTILAHGPYIYDEPSSVKSHIDSNATDGQLRLLTTPHAMAVEALVAAYAGGVPTTEQARHRAVADIKRDYAEDTREARQRLFSRFETALEIAKERLSAVRDLADQVQRPLPEEARVSRASRVERGAAAVVDAIVAPTPTPARDVDLR